MWLLESFWNVSHVSIFRKDKVRDCYKVPEMYTVFQKPGKCHIVSSMLVEVSSKVPVSDLYTYFMSALYLKDLRKCVWEADHRRVTFVLRAHFVVRMIKVQSSAHYR